MMVVWGRPILRIDIPPLDVDLQPSQPWDVVRNELSDGWEAVCDTTGVGAGEAEGGYGACVDGTDNDEEGCEDGEAQGWGGGRGPGVWVIGEFRGTVAVAKEEVSSGSGEPKSKLSVFSR